MDEFKHKVLKALRAHALKFDDVTEGTSCVNRAFKKGKKNFLFLGEKTDNCRVMFKLKDSIDEVASMDDPRVGAGKTGWVTVNFAPDDALPLRTLKKWVKESYALF